MFLTFPLHSNTLPNKDKVTFEDALKDLEKERPAYWNKVSARLQSTKLSKDNLIKSEHKTLKEFQNDISNVI